MAETESIPPSSEATGSRAEGAPVVEAARCGATTTAAEPPVREGQGESASLQPGRQFGGYRIIRWLGAGGMGAVYEAQHLESGRRVAMKVLGRSLDAPSARQRFLREGQLAALVSHPNVVYVFGTEEIEQTPVITMELMPGGTLEDQVCRGGPMPVGKAVDAILQVIEGLDAVASAGVLHRDIKPSNCFTAPDGAVKIGDFGLSLARDNNPTDSRLSEEETYAGTPAYCSPEQIRGDPLDVRSDVYSVGATLFFLLTGRTPFVSTSVIRLISKVLERAPESPGRYRPDVPDELAKIVSRCLGKRPEERFGSYAELRNALLPFGSIAASPATLGLRFLAWVFDSLLCGSVAILFGLSLYSAGMGFARWFVAHPAGFASLSVVGLAWAVLYFAATEYVWRASPGKLICQLGVVSCRNRFTRSQALIRASAFVILPELPFWALLALLPARVVSGQRSITQELAMAAPHFVFLGLMVCTMRRRNGFAAVQDLLSGTRVVAKRSFGLRPRGRRAEEAPERLEGARTVGPYAVIRSVRTADGGELMLGYDPRLRRKVWIRSAAAGQAAVECRLRNLCRPGRLHWLDGKRSAGENWDAYEAASGAPFLAIMRKPQPWGIVRYWLSDLATELQAALQDGSVPDSLSLDRLWIDSENRVKLLDFAGPVMDSCPLKAMGTSDRLDFPAVQHFLRQVALSALTGLVVCSEAAPEPIAVPLPLHARALLKQLLQAESPATIVSEIQPALHRPAAVSRGRRLALLAGCCVVPIVVTAMLMFFQVVLKQWTAVYPEVMPLEVCLEELEANQPDPGQTLGPAAQARRDAMEVYIAGRFRTVIMEPTVWESPYVKQVLTERQQRLAESVLSRHPRPSGEQFREASALLKPFLDYHFRKTGPSPAVLDEIGVILGMTTILFVAIPAVLAALLFRGGLLMYPLGLVFVDATGSRASHLQVFRRAVIAWGPVLVLCVLLVLKSPLTGWVDLGLLAIVIFGAASAMMSPERALQDRLVGTYLLPR